MERIIGLYIHQHWPYRHPYAARTWSAVDWRRWADGIRELGYNTVLIWPMLETMPEPLTPSDRASLEKLAQVIPVLRERFGMRVYLTLCPNIVADDAEASRVPFEARHYYDCERLVDPGDPAALAALIHRREELLRPLAAIDGVAIIDSDPGGYPGATNAAFVALLAAHRRMLDRLRPGIELIYWMHAGWRGWSRLYETGTFALGTPEEHRETLALLKELDPEPWGLANGLPYAEELGLASRVIAFNYGRIEGEPSFPMTHFGGTAAYEGGRDTAPRGVMGNAQTHCVQLPNIFAFARGATGRSLTVVEYERFADGLIPSEGGGILRAWSLLAGGDPDGMEMHAERLSRRAASELATGRLAGLLFDDPRRFLTDLAMMLRLRAARQRFLEATEQGAAMKEPFARFIAAARTWQGQHGYENNWHDPELHRALRRLGAPALDAALSVTCEAREPFDPGVTAPGEQVRRNFRAIERFTPRLLAAMETALEEIA